MDPIQNWGITRLKMYTENIFLSNFQCISKVQIYTELYPYEHGVLIVLHCNLILTMHYP
jgi:hypothetical protein